MLRAGLSILGLAERSCAMVTVAETAGATETVTGIASVSALTGAAATGRAETAIVDVTAERVTVEAASGAAAGRAPVRTSTATTQMIITATMVMVTTAIPRPRPKRGSVADDEAQGCSTAAQQMHIL